MTLSNPLPRVKTVATITLLCCSLFLSACDDKSSEKKENVAQQQPEQTAIVELNSGNINQYAREIAENYINKQATLLKAFHDAKQNNDSFSFVQYRNNVWSEDYVALKQRYTQVFKLNKSFLANQPTAPLFGLYENLMYIGLDLKNGLLDDDKARQQRALDAAEKDRKQVEAILKTLP